ncbi:MAG: zinc-binding alcohol dehydrogenase family protein [Scytolyngbya sp. HA4215-MV1]|jgi:NADPH:quinone reductase-like Zn-dependent oxidoreductase|nr:zinc-binding alcohol dehydrogenase family protein [Scytolyngbya sp. HA4215-MV1]
MLALRFAQFGAPTVLKLAQIPHPVLEEDEVLVKIHAAAINPSDVKNVQGSMEGTILPRTPGRDFAGVVVQGSESLLGLEVWGTGGDVGFTRDGSHAEYIVLPKAAVKPKPSTLSMFEAGSAGVTYVTAWLALMETAQLIAADTVLVIGATGGVGSAAIQIARWLGARVMGTVRRSSDLALAEMVGAEVIINLESQDLQQSVLEATDGQGASVILDTVGGAMAETCLQVLSRKGRLLEISAPPGNSRISFDLRDFYHREARLFGIDSRSVDVTGCAAILAALTPGFEAGALRLFSPTMKSYSLAEAIQAYEQVADKTLRGRGVLVPQV